MIPGFFAIIFGRRLFMMDRIIGTGFGFMNVSDRFDDWLLIGIERNRSNLHAIRAIHAWIIGGSLIASLLASGDLLVAVQIGQLILGCVVWSWYGAALRDIFFGGLEERERRLAPAEAT